MEEFKVFRSLIMPVLKMGLPVGILGGLYFLALLTFILIMKVKVLLFFGLLHFILSILVKYVDVHFVEIIRDYMVYDKGELK